MLIQIIEGYNKGLEVSLPRGSCRALGRSLDDVEKTKAVESGGEVPLTDSTKQLILNYAKRQFGAGDAEQEGQGELGSFRRLSDIALTDSSVSRLHAMIFHGPHGVGILDLVSKNGTYVNGVEVEHQMLKAGDIVTLGGSKLRAVPSTS